MSHPLSSLRNIPHGLAVLMCTVSAINYNKSKIYKDVVEITNFLNMKKKKFNSIIQFFKNYKKKYDLANEINNYKFTANEIPEFCNQTLQIGAINTSKKKINYNQLIKLFSESLIIN
jgi:alcohol dehydrogenase class IV